jgi:hypothetical protein
MGMSDEEAWGVPAQPVGMSDEEAWGVPAQPQVGNLGDAFHRSLVKGKQVGQQILADQMTDRAINQPLGFSEILENNANPGYMPDWAQPVPLMESAYDWAVSREPVTDLFGDTSSEDRAIQAQQNVGMTQNEMNAIPQVQALQNVANLPEDAGVMDTVSSLFKGGIIEGGEGILALGAESSLPMVAGVATGLLTRDPAKAAAVMGLTAGGNERYLEPVSYFANQGFDLSKREDVERAMQNPQLMEDAKRRGFDRAVIIGSFTALSGLAAGTNVVQNPVGNMAAQTFGIQPALGAGGEAAAQIAVDGEINWKDITLEALGELAGAPIEVVGLNAELRDSIRAKKGNDEVTPNDLAEEAQAGNQDAAAILREMGVSDEQLASMSPEFQEIAAGRVENIREEEAARMDPQDPSAGSNRKFKNDQERLAAEQQAVADGDIDPNAASTAGRTHEGIPDVMPVNQAGQADANDQGINAAIDRNKHRPTTETALVPTEPDATGTVRQPMSDEEVAAAQEQNSQTTEVNPDPIDHAAAGEAFELADRQRNRASEESADTQTAGRPEGAAQEDVTLHEGFPVKVTGAQINMATGKPEVQIQRYDPRTGEVEPGSEPYVVPATEIQSSKYATDPRRAQDFEERAEVGKVNKGKAKGQRADEVQDLDRQTYRTTDEDPEVPGADGPTTNVDDRGPTTRADRPEQDDGPSPWQTRTRTEEEAVRQAEAYRQEQERRQQQEEQRRQEQARQGQQQQEQTQHEDDGGAFEAKGTSNKAKVDKDGYYPTHDHKGEKYVVSEKGGPITFPDQKQAAKWMQKVGYKNANEDQIFVIVPHPFKTRNTGSGGTESLYTLVESQRNPDARAANEQSAQAEAQAEAQEESRGQHGKSTYADADAAETRGDARNRENSQPGNQRGIPGQAEPEMDFDAAPEPETKSEPDVENSDKPKPQKPKRPPGAGQLAREWGIKYDDVVRHNLRKGRNWGKRFVGLLRAEGKGGVSLDRLGESFAQMGYWNYERGTENDVMELIENDALLPEDEAQYEADMAEYDGSQEDSRNRDAYESQFTSAEEQAEFESVSAMADRYSDEYDSWESDTGVEDYYDDGSEPVNQLDFERQQDEIAQSEDRNAGESADGQAANAGESRQGEAAVDEGKAAEEADGDIQPEESHLDKEVGDAIGADERVAPEDREGNRAKAQVGTTGKKRTKKTQKDADEGLFEAAAEEDANADDMFSDTAEKTALDKVKNPQLWKIPEDQEYTSSSTSINSKKLPVGITKARKAGAWSEGDTNLDIGGGRYDNTTEALNEEGAINYTYDPFNRTPEENADAVNSTGDGQADTVTVHNTLNVIKESKYRDRILRQAWNALKPGGTLYITVYPGNKSGEGRATQKDQSWQENRPPSSYKAEVKRHFKNVRLENGMLIATKPEATTSSKPTPSPKPEAKGGKFGRIAKKMVRKKEHGVEYVAPAPKANLSRSEFSGVKQDLERYEYERKKYEGSPKTERDKGTKSEVGASAANMSTQAIKRLEEFVKRIEENDAYLPIEKSELLSQAKKAIQDIVAFQQAIIKTGPKWTPKTKTAEPSEKGRVTNNMGTVSAFAPDGKQIGDAITFADRKEADAFRDELIADLRAIHSEEPAPKTKGVNRKSTTLHSFPSAMFDPDVYKSIGQGFKAALKGTTSLTKPLRTLVSKIISASDAYMRADFKERGLDTPAVMKVLDMFNAVAGKADGVGRTFFEAMEQRVGEQYAALDDALGKFRDDEKAMKQIVKLLRNPRNLRAGTPLHDAALAVRKLLDEHLEYMREAGVDIGEVKNGYFPREMDSDVIMKNPAGFVAAAAQAYRENGMDAASARKAAEALRDEIIYGHLKGAGQGSAAAPFVKGRVFGKSVDNDTHPLNKFLVHDHVASLSQYINRAAKRAEIARRFGDNFKNTEELEQDIIAEGSGEAIDDLRAHIEAMTGSGSIGVRPDTAKIFQNIRMWSALMYLERATSSSLGEIVMPAVRTGNLGDLGTAIAETLKGFRKGKNKSEARKFAEDLGMIVGHLGESIMSARYAGEDMNGQMQSKILDRYFKRIGLEQFTEATRIASTKIGNVFINRLANDVASGGKRAKLSTELLAELGITADQAVEFSNWMANRKGEFPSDLDSEMGEIYKTAIWRFVDQTIMRPNKAMKPRAANHPLGQVIYHLQAFTMTFYQNVMKRSGRMAKRAATEGGLTMQERARLMAPAMMLPVLLGFQAAISELRDELTMDPERRKNETESQKVFKWMSRSGMFGAMDPWLNMFKAASRYQRGAMESLAGPGVGAVGTGVDALIAVIFANSNTTNTQERKAWRALYNVGIEPLANYAMSRFFPGGIITKAGKAAFTQWIGSGHSREDFLTSMAGPHGEKTNQTDTKTGRTARKPREARSSR